MERAAAAGRQGSLSALAAKRDSLVNHKLPAVMPAAVGCDVTGKDVAGALDATASGVDLVRGLEVWGNSSKLSCLLPSLLYATCTEMLCPADVACLLGHVQWLDLLNRPLLSSLDTCYAFARRSAQTTLQLVPAGVKGELALALGLALFWSLVRNGARH